MYNIDKIGSNIPLYDLRLSVPSVFLSKLHGRDHYHIGVKQRLIKKLFSDASDINCRHKK